MPEITTEHMRKVRSMARRVCGTAWAHLREDCEGAAFEALAIAAQQWDGRGTFEGYGLQRAKFAAFDELDRLVGRDPGSRNVRSPESFDQLFTNWLGHDNMED